MAPSLLIATDGTIDKEGRRFLFKEDFEIVDMAPEVALVSKKNPTSSFPTMLKSE